jgi:hypothetical protein
MVLKQRLKIGSHICLKPFNELLSTIVGSVIENVASIVDVGVPEDDG